MIKCATDIEKSMAFLMSKDLRKTLRADDGVAHLLKARNLLENLGLKEQSETLNKIIRQAITIDDSAIEVE